MMFMTNGLLRRISMSPAPYLCVMIAALLFPGSALSEQYLCVPDKATGFYYDKYTETWEYATFRTDKRYVISPARDGENAYRFTKIGEKDPDGYCKNEFNESGFLFCSTFGGDVKFNRINGRYLSVFTYAYTDVGTPGFLQTTDEDSGTPMIEIGKCSPY